MTANEWSWLTSTITLGIAYSSGINPKLGWKLSLGSQVPWAIYGASTGQYGLVALSAGLGAIYIRNLWRNRGRDFRNPTTQVAELVASNKAMAAEVARLHALLDECPAGAGQVRGK